MEGIGDGHPLLPYWDLRSGKELVVEVENPTQAVIDRLYVLWQYTGDSPDIPDAPIQSAISRLQESGGNTIFEPQAAGDESSLSTDLASGERCRFNARIETVRQMLDRMAALSPAQYWISIQAQGAELARIPGLELKTFLDLAQPVETATHNRAARRRNTTLGNRTSEVLETSEARCKHDLVTLAVAAGARPIAAGARPILAGSRLVDGQGTPLELGAVQTGDGLVGAVAHLDEGKPARPARVTVRDHLGRLDRAVVAERLGQVVACGTEGEVADVQFLTHVNSF
jgi:hypothetical protein